VLLKPFAVSGPADDGPLLAGNCQIPVSAADDTRQRAKRLDSAGRSVNSEHCPVHIRAYDRGRTSMNMKAHILAALKELFIRWEALLASLSDEQITAPRFDDNWSIKDVITHLWAWQQISVARIAAAALDREPVFPDWTAALQKDWEENANRTNARVYEIYHEKPWSEVYQDWRAGFLRLLELGELVPERDLLDGGRYPWLEGYSLAFILLASYDHQQEHFEKTAHQVHDQVAR
jgi:hypothetical protein